MNLFKIGFGPWERLFSGVFQEHDIELYSNPEKVLLILIYEKKLDAVEGAIAEVYKVFSAKGEVESFIETLPREAMIITKHDEKTTHKFLLLGSKPVYVKWSESEFIEEVDNLLKRLDASSTMMKEVSKAYELDLKEIGEEAQDVQISFFSQPMLVPAIAPFQQHGTMQEPQLRPITKGEIMLGITRDRNRVIEPMSLFTRTLVTDGEPHDRYNVLQVIGESALLANIPAVFVDFERKFSGIGEANKNPAELQKYDVNVDPLGFPARLVKARSDIKVDLNILNPDAVAELFGVGEKDFPRIYALAAAMGEIGSVNELIERISNIGQTEEFSEFKIRKAARIIKLMDAVYPNLFGSQNDVDEMAKQGMANIARATVVEFEAMDERSSLLLFSSLVKGIYNYARKRGKTQELRMMLIVPNAKNLKRRERRAASVDELLDILGDASNYGVCYTLAADTELDVPSQIKGSAKAQINVVNANDIGVQLANKKAYRVLVRPTLSRQAP